ncbi:MAG: DNA/RNA helicase domain-containing protein [Acetatifactor sp.]
MKGIKKLYKESPEEAKKRADEIIKNTYRTLMTRGMKGCYIYCTDEGMKKYLVNRLETMRNEAGNNRQN